MSYNEIDPYSTKERVKSILSPELRNCYLTLVRQDNHFYLLSKLSLVLNIQPPIFRKKKVKYTVPGTSELTN